MVIEVGILFAITSMLSWGIADFFAKKAVDKIGYTKSLLINQLIAFVPLFIYSSLFFDFHRISLNLVFIIALTAFSGVIGYLYFYKGLQKGNISIVSPIASSWVVVTILLSILIFGEKLTSLQVIGIIAIFIGIFLTSTNLKEFRKGIKKGLSSGFSEAIIAMIAWGISFFLLKPIVDTTGAVVAALFVRAMMLLFMFSWIRVIRIKISFPTKLVFVFLIVSGLLDVLGLITYNIGITTEFVSIVSSISAIFPAVTIILAYIFLKERIVGNQKIGIVAILSGLVIISLV